MPIPPISKDNNYLGSVEVLNRLKAKRDAETDPEELQALADRIRRREQQSEAQKQKILDCINQLKNPRAREAARLAFLEGKNREQIAAKIGVCTRQVSVYCILAREVYAAQQITQASRERSGAPGKE